MKRIYLLLTAIILQYSHLFAVNLGEVRFNNEKTDTTALTDILIELDCANLDSTGKMVAYAAKKLLGKPYKSGTLEGESEMLTVNTDEFDCTTLVETAVALAMTVNSRRTSWRDYIYSLENLRYRGGAMDGYPSRLHYISDWIVDNSHRGNLWEATDRIGKADYQVKTIDFMSRHRDLYPALKDSTTFARMKSAEIGYRSHRYPYIKPMNLKNADLREGDIVAITTSAKGLDVSHIGIVSIKNGVPHLIHASSKAGKVIYDPLPLQEYLRKNRTATGIRVIRLKN